MTLYLPDTHAIYWYESKDAKLSGPAAAAFSAASAGRATKVAYAVVLAELYLLLKKYGDDAMFLPYVGFVQASPVYRYEPISMADVRRLDDFQEVSEMHDRLIAIAAERLGATIITRDPATRACPRVNCLW